MVDSTLFVLFGRGIDGTFSPSLITIDVSDATNIAYKSSYSLSNGTLNNAANNNSAGNITENDQSGINGGRTNDTNTEFNDDSSQGLSSGAIGGISAGGAILVSVYTIDFTRFHVILNTYLIYFSFWVSLHYFFIAVAKTKLKNIEQLIQQMTIETTYRNYYMLIGTKSILSTRNFQSQQHPLSLHKYLL